MNDINPPLILQSVPKFCVFCGKKPKPKTKEHILSRWLIEYTGDPKRDIFLFPVWDPKTNTFNKKFISFDQFTFPSCETCNNKFSEFEAKAKSVVYQLVNNQALSSTELSILMSWLDKIRIGLWLSFYYLQRNISGIEPNYYISDRIDLSDRLIFIYLSNYSKRRVNFIGATLPAFQYLPICFGLVINNYYLFNMATHSLISSKLGLPYVSEKIHTETNPIRMTLNQGKEYIRYPIIRQRFHYGCREIYQPIYSMFRSLVPDLYDNEYVNQMSLDDQSGIGKVFFANNGTLFEYPGIGTKEWIPDKIWEDNEMMDTISKQVLRFQIEYLKNMVDFGNITMGKKRLIKSQRQLAIYVNNLFLKE